MHIYTYIYIYIIFLSKFYIVLYLNCIVQRITGINYTLQSWKLYKYTKHSKQQNTVFALYRERERENLTKNSYYNIIKSKNVYLILTSLRLLYLNDTHAGDAQKMYNNK